MNFISCNLIDLKTATSNQNNFSQDMIQKIIFIIDQLILNKKDLIYINNYIKNFDQWIRNNHPIHRTQDKNIKKQMNNITLLIVQYF